MSEVLAAAWHRQSLEHQHVTPAGSRKQQFFDLLASRTAKKGESREFDVSMTTLGYELPESDKISSTIFFFIDTCTSRSTNFFSLQI